MPLGVIRSQVSRRYGDFRGIDLLNPETSIQLNRSPDCLNVWKSYDTQLSNIIQTRPGIKEKADVSEEEENNTVYSIYAVDYGGGNGDVLVHKGTKLIHLENTPTTLFSSMAENEPSMTYFRDGVYIVDGQNYIKSDFTSVADKSINGTIPTTTRGRSPSRWWRNVSRY